LDYILRCLFPAGKISAEIRAKRVETDASERATIGVSHAVAITAPRTRKHPSSEAHRCRGV
jgi:hypothetical protein